MERLSMLSRTPGARSVDALAGEALGSAFHAGGETDAAAGIPAMVGLARAVAR